MSGLFSGLFGGGGSNTQIVIPEGEAPRAFQTVKPQNPKTPKPQIYEFN